MKHREYWNKAQHTPQFSNRSNKCLNCAGNHRTHDCPTRQQPHVPPTRNPANGTGIYKNNSPQQHSQQSASIVGISTPTLMVNNQLQMGPQGQQQHPSPQVPPVSQQANSPKGHHQFNQHFQQPPVPQVHLWHHHNSITLKFYHHSFINIHLQIHVVHQLAVMKHCLQEYFTDKWTW